MTLVKRNGHQSDVNAHFFDDFLNRDLFNWGNLNFSATNTSLPAVNIKETTDNFEIEVAAPGLSKDDFTVELNNDILVIRSERAKSTNDQPNERFSRKEFSYQTFQRSFSLQRSLVEVDKIAAKYQDGILQLLIPKKEAIKQQPARTIQAV